METRKTSGITEPDSPTVEVIEKTKPITQIDPDQLLIIQQALNTRQSSLEKCKEIQEQVEELQKEFEEKKQQAEFAEQNLAGMLRMLFLIYGLPKNAAIDPQTGVVTYKDEEDGNAEQSE